MIISIISIPIIIIHHFLYQINKYHYYCWIDLIQKAKLLHQGSRLFNTPSQLWMVKSFQLSFRVLSSICWYWKKKYVLCGWFIFIFLLLFERLQLTIVVDNIPPSPPPQPSNFLWRLMSVRMFISWSVGFFFIIFLKRSYTLHSSSIEAFVCTVL